MGVELDVARAFARSLNGKGRTTACQDSRATRADFGSNGRSPRLDSILTSNFADPDVRAGNFPRSRPKGFRPSPRPPPIGRRASTRTKVCELPSCRPNPDEPRKGCLMGRSGVTVGFEAPRPARAPAFHPETRKHHGLQAPKLSYFSCSHHCLRPAPVGSGRSRPPHQRLWRQRQRLGLERRRWR